MTMLNDATKESLLDWPIPSWMPPGDTVVLVGAPGIGKTWVALWAATQVVGLTATEHPPDPTLAHPVVPRPLVSYIGYEHEMLEIARRRIARYKPMCFSMDFSHPAGKASTILDSKDDNLSQALETANPKNKRSLLVLDLMLSSVFGDPPKERLVIRLVDFIRSHQCSCLVVANGCVDGAGAYGLPPVVAAAVPYLWKLTPNPYKGTFDMRESICTESALMLTCEKARYAEKPRPRFFEHAADGTLYCPKEG